MVERAIFSETAEQHGYGSDPWKWVSHMTPDERAFARAGGTVVFRAERLSGGNHGTVWRKALVNGQRFLPRVADRAEVEVAGQAWD